MSSLPMSYFEAWMIGRLNSQYNLEMGFADNQGIDCIEFKNDVERIKNETMDIQK